MYGGIHAKRGFNYQDTVVLELLIGFFKEHGSSGTVRPEGLDDLELSWTASDGAAQKRFIQVKKPREDRAAIPTGTPWTLAHATRELLPGTIRRLDGNIWEQHWILGDGVADDLGRLFCPGDNPTTSVPQLYWTTVHNLAKHTLNVEQSLTETKRREIARWRPSPELLTDPSDIIPLLVRDFGTLLQSYLSVDVAEQYRHALSDVHRVLASALSRIRIIPSFGAEEDVAERVRQSLVHLYNLHPEVVSNVFFRNLRGFVNDVATIPGRTFRAEEFEIELRTIWPTMIPVRNPPPMDRTDLRRPALVHTCTSQLKAQAVEVIGISGSGKTTLAAAVCEQFRIECPGQPVFYVEIEPGTELQDVLVGILFRLRRYGYTEGFHVASRHAAGQTAHDVVLSELAYGITGSGEACLLVLDMVRGNCSDKFARDLRCFLMALRGSRCRLSVFGQESAFRELTELERAALPAESLDMPGFSLEEFTALVGQSHTGLDYGVLQRVFEALTAGRSVGLYGRLARAVADANSLDEMVEISRRPGAELLQRSEREKFARLSNSARPAAEKISCFALAFRHDEAEDVFQDVNVGVAIKELLEVGLLRDAGDDSFEMHETVRAGIEGAIALSTRREAHFALARYYGQTGKLSTEVFHLEKAGEEQQARDCARSAFLNGKSWSQLYNYVTIRGLVTAEEVIDVVSATRSVDGIYLFPEVLSKLGTKRHCDRLLDVMRAQNDRFGKDFNWSIAMAGAFLALSPERAEALYRLSISVGCSDEHRRDAVSAVVVASSRLERRNSWDLCGLFDSFPTNLKLQFLPPLFEDGSRDCLRRAFAVMDGRVGVDRGELSWSQELPFLRLEHHTEVVEFLAAVPPVEDAQMLVCRSPLLGRLGPFIWKNREFLESHCITILESDEGNSDVQKNAIRVLALSGSEQLCSLCDEIARRAENAIHGFAAIAPCLAAGLVDVNRYEERVLNPDIPVPLRLAAFRVLACAGADLDALCNRLRETDASSFDDRWHTFLLMFAAEHPFFQAIPMLEKRLDVSDERQSALFSVVVRVLGTLAGELAMDMLKHAIAHRNPPVRLAAALALQEKRSSACLPILRKQIASEGEEVVRRALAAAICGAGPTDVDDLRAKGYQDEGVVRWQCVLAGRTKDGAFASELVRIANNESLNWQLRRAAIRAAEYLPFELALEHMMETVRVGSTLVDGHIGLYAHSFLSHLLGYDLAHLLQEFVGGRDGFAKFVGELFDGCAKDLMDKDNLGDGVAVGDWAYSRLSAAGWPDDPRAPDVVIDELCRPLLFSALLRSLRLVGRVDLIESEIAISRTPWCVMKCVVECQRSGYAGVERARRLRDVTGESGIPLKGRIQNVIDEIAGNRRRQMGVGEQPVESQEPAPTVLSYREAVRLLMTENSSHGLDERSTVVLEDVTEGELRRLVELADPSMEERGVDVYVPGISFRGYGHTVATRHVTYGADGEPAGAWIRPAIVAANLYQVDIRWHDRLLARVGAEIYVRRVIGCFIESGNVESLYGLLSRDGGQFLQALGASVTSAQLSELVDERVVPILRAYAAAGTDEMLESLARVSRSISSADIDNVLVLLWKRWIGEFGAREEDVAAMQNHHYWRAFRELTDHARFGEIRDWHKDLAPLLYSRGLHWFVEEKIVEVLARDRRSYVHLEGVLFGARDWEHRYMDEIEMLNGACDRLFVETD